MQILLHGPCVFYTLASVGEDHCIVFFVAIVVVVICLFMCIGVTPKCSHHLYFIVIMKLKLINF
jgi:hypothetical protein